MGKSTNGPDWEDIGASLKNLERAHGCVCSLVMSPAGVSLATKLSCTAYAYQAAQGYVSGAPFVAVSGEWPHSGWKSVEGMVYNLLLRLDKEITHRWYTQEEMFN